MAGREERQGESRMPRGAFRDGGTTGRERAAAAAVVATVTSVGLQVHGVPDFGRRLRGHRPARPRVQVMRSDRFDVRPTLARVPGDLAGRPGHAAVERGRRAARDVHRGAEGHADRVRRTRSRRSRCKTHNDTGNK